MRDWYRGCALVFQTRETGSSPVSRSTLTKEKAMKRKLIVKQRNRFVALTLFRKAGVHRKSNKAMRKSLNQAYLGS